MKTTPLFVGDENGLRDVEVMFDGRVARKGDFDPEFGENLKLRRVKLNLTQAQLAAYLGVNYVTLSRIETAKTTFSSKMRQRIEEGLDELEQYD